MKILIVSFSVNGSMGDNFRVISKGLSYNNDVYVLTNAGENDKRLGTKNIYCIRFDRKKIGDFVNPVSYARIWRYIKSIKYDVIFICSPHPINVFVYAIADNSRIIPYVHDHILHSGVGHLDAFFLRLNLMLNYKRSPKVIVSCRTIKNEILKKGLMHDERKIEVNYLGVLTNLIFPIKICNEDIDVLFFGRIEAYKGLDSFIKVAMIMTDKRFYIIGRGDLNAVCGNLRLPDNCTHINEYVEDYLLAEYIQRAKVVLLPYKDATGTQTIQTVFYYGKPIVATTVGCFPEYIADGKDGILVKPGSTNEILSALHLLLDDNELRYEMGRNGKGKLTSEFSNETITRRYEEIFKSIS